MTFTLNDFLALLPEAILATMALVVLLVGLFLRVEQRRWLAWLSLLSVAGALVATLTAPTSSEPMVQGMLRVDVLAKFLNVVFLLGGGFTLMLSADYLERQGAASGEYYALILFATLGAMLMGSGADLLMIFLGLETLSIPLYILSSFFRHQTASQEAGFKYFLLGSFSSALLLYGVALVYGATGTTQLGALAGAVSGALAAKPLLLYAGAGLLLVGLSFKSAAVPFHTWAPDVYEGAPTSTTAFMAVAAKAGAFAAFIRIFADPFVEFAGSWAILVGVIAALTMTLGNLVALVQTNLKRLLAYSSIAHAGYLLIGVAAAQTPELAANATSGLGFYLLVYTLMTLGAFGVVMLAEGRGENLSLEDVAGFAWRAPGLGTVMAIFMISLAGLPPTAGFFGKFYVFQAAIQADLLWLAIVGVVTSVVSVYYYLRVVYTMVMRPAATDRTAFHSRLAWVGLTIMAIGILLLGLYPTLAYGWLGQLTTIAAAP